MQLAVVCRQRIRARFAFAEALRRRNVMNRKVATLAAVLFGLGCSHARPQPEKTPIAWLPPPQAAQAPKVTSRAVPVEPKAMASNEPKDKSIFFDFDSALIRQDAQPTLLKVGKQLVRNGKSIRIEGNCDERGTTEYNIALGDRRAREAKDYLERLGISGKRIAVLSYGSERPRDSGHDERAWSKNRRDDLRVQ
jgi:peptidoglycan-associated lipoprotein